MFKKPLILFRNGLFFIVAAFLSISLAILSEDLVTYIFYPTLLIGLSLHLVGIGYSVRMLIQREKQSQAWLGLFLNLSIPGLVALFFTTLAVVFILIE